MFNKEIIIGDIYLDLLNFKNRNFMRLLSNTLLMKYNFEKPRITNYFKFLALFRLLNNQQLLN